MSNHPEQPTDEPADRLPPKRKPASSLGDALRGLARAASEAATTGGQEARRLAETARPEVERRAKQAKAAVDAATPHVKQATADATDYVREHQDELRRGARRGAGVIADQAVRAVTPRPLRPAIDAIKNESRAQPATTAEAPDETADQNETRD